MVRDNKCTLIVSGSQGSRRGSAEWFMLTGMVVGRFSLPGWQQGPLYGAARVTSRHGSQLPPTVNAPKRERVTRRRVTVPSVTWSHKWHHHFCYILLVTLTNLVQERTSLWSEFQKVRIIGGVNLEADYQCLNVPCQQQLSTRQITMMTMIETIYWDPTIHQVLCEVFVCIASK